MVTERTERKGEDCTTNQTDTVRIVIERRQKGKTKILFQRKTYMDASNRPRQSWDLPMDRTEGEACERTIGYMTQRLFGRERFRSQRIWESEPRLVPFKSRPSQFMVDAVYKVSAVGRVTLSDGLKLLRPEEALEDEYDLPEVTRKFLTDICVQKDDGK